MGDDAGRARIHAGADADGGQDRVRGEVLRAMPSSAGPEACDTAGDSATCDRDCTLVVCGDDYVHTTAEQCDPPLKAYCTTSCRLENP